MWDSENFLHHVPTTLEDVPLPWRDELPLQVSEPVAVARTHMARPIAMHGLDGNRSPHGFTVIVGGVAALESCGKAGLIPSRGAGVT